MRHLLLIAGLLTVVFLEGQSRPNILFIESDDQSNQAVGSYGHPEVITPHIDGLAEDGVSFTAAYNMGCWSPAVCVPSRTMLLYGKQIWEAQKITRKNAPETYIEKFRQAGYETYVTGKWHAMGKAAGTVFDSTGSIQPGQLKTYRTDQGHVTDITGKEAADYLQGYDSGRPFFVYVAFNAPHVPRQTEDKYYDLYPREGIKLPPSVVEGPLNPNIEYNYTTAPLKKATMRARVQQNDAMVTHMDERIGDIIQVLKNKGLYEETIIVFTSDHGISFGENGVAGKVCLYEPSVTAPLIIKAPGIEARTQVQGRVYLQDVMPTLCELAAVATPDNIVFESLLPQIEGKNKARKSLYLAMFDDQRGIVVGKHKLILYPKSGDIEYYRLDRDPWETINLSTKRKSRKPMRRLLSELQIWQARFGDKVLLTREAFGL